MSYCIKVYDGRSKEPFVYDSISRKECNSIVKYCLRHSFAFQIEKDGILFQNLYIPLFFEEKFY